MYGMGINRIAKNMGVSLEEAQNILDNFYKSFPKVKEFSDNSIKMARNLGYVTDAFGRRRRLPIMQLPEYEIVSKTKEITFNPFLSCSNRSTINNDVLEIQDKLKKVRSKFDYNKVVKDANNKGYNIIANNSLIGKESKKCLNARIQGSAASMTKIAMAKIHKDEELNKLGFRLLIQVHDELIGECPEENKDKVAERLTYLMRTCIADVCDVPFKCDADISYKWYYNEYSASIKNEYRKLLKNNDESTSRNIIYENHIESLREDIDAILNEG